MSKLASRTARRRYDYVPIEPNRRPVEFTWIACLLIALVVVTLTATLVVFTSSANDSPASVPPGGSSGHNLTSVGRPLGRVGLREPDSGFPAIRDEDVEAAYRKASEELHGRHRDTNHTCNASRMDTFLQFYNADLRQRHFQDGVFEGDIEQRATLIIKDQYQLQRHLADVRLRSHRIGKNNRLCWSKRATPRPRCDARSRYRTHDGTCNNLHEPLWGAAGMPYARGLPPDYADGVASPRVSSHDGSILPSARDVSIEIHSSRTPVESRISSAMMAFWGQFVAHDVSKLAPNLKSLSCCDFPDNESTSDCIPIKISAMDPFYSRFNVTCIGLGRSAPASGTDCVLGPREQVNLLTAYLDASVIYGSNPEEAEQLRSFQNGQLKTSHAVNNTFLPYFDTNTTTCTQDDSDNFCFYAGDSRCNENIALTSLHTVFLREHNRLSVLLAALNPSWGDEKLYQETRRLVTAELQHVTYAEFLPTLVGADVASRFDLSSLGQGYYRNYSDEVDATVANEFAAAAFRFGHSAVNGRFMFSDDRATRTMQLHQGLFASSILTRNPETLARLVYGTVVESALAVDPYVNEQITNHVFQTKHSEYGFDLNAISIQRGRDHGVPDYNSFRRYCGLDKLKTFAELESVVGAPLARRYASLYKSIEDLDLHSLGLAEHPLAGGQLGPTFTCLIGDQFARLRRGDRFWYENGPESSPYPFGEEQLAQIRNVTLARIICDNVPNISNLPPNAFLLQTSRNKPVSCSGSGIPRLDVNFWDSAKYNF